VLFDTLIQRHTTQELVAVLAHEMGHYKKKHILLGMLLGFLQTGIVLYLFSLCISHPGLYDAFYMDTRPIYAGLIFFGMLYAPVDFFTGILLMMMSRRNEYAADRFSVETTDGASALISALKKLSVDNLSNLRPHPLYTFLTYSHPPVLERIRAAAGTGAPVGN
jgi:STE24 endopeptidase